MTLTIQLETDWVLGFWTLHGPRSNWLAVALLRNEETWVVQGRVRIARPGEEDEIGDPFLVEVPAATTSEARVVEAVLEARRRMREMGVGDVEDQVWVRSSEPDDVQAALSRLIGIDMGPGR